MAIIANADDFGKSHEVYLGFVEGFGLGILQRTTLPFVDETVQLSKENKFFDKIGLHLNLTEGVSLAENIRCISWLYTEKSFISRIICHNCLDIENYLSSLSKLF